jgi:hypothetical protein
MFVALHGDFLRHPWQDAEDDPMLDYLLRDRTQAMGWSMNVGAGVGLGTADVLDAQKLWDVRDAGPEPVTPAPAGQPVAWFYVLARSPVIAPLPVRALLAGCAASLSRLGRLELSAVHALLPVERIDPSHRVARFPSVDGGGWWLNSDPRARTNVRVSVDSGREPAAAIAAEAVVARLAALDQRVVRPDVTTLREGHPDAPEFVFSDHLWPGPPQRCVSFVMSLAEWNVDTVGWTASLIADLLADEGVRTPTLVTVTKENAG